MYLHISYVYIHLHILYNINNISYILDLCLSWYAFSSPSNLLDAPFLKVEPFREKVPHIKDLASGCVV